jgi:hypothetical protein
VERDAGGAPSRLVWLGVPHGPTLTRAQRDEARQAARESRRREQARALFVAAGREVPEWLRGET